MRSLIHHAGKVNCQGTDSQVQLTLCRTFHNSLHIEHNIRSTLAQQSDLHLVRLNWHSTLMWHMNRSQDDEFSPFLAARQTIPVQLRCLLLAVHSKSQTHKMVPVTTTIGSDPHYFCICSWGEGRVAFCTDFFCCCFLLVLSYGLSCSALPLWIGAFVLLFVHLLFYFVF